MATRLELLLATIFDNKGAEEAKASVEEVNSSLASLSAEGLSDLSADIDITTNDSELIATREEISELSNLAPVVSLMVDDSEGVATKEEIRAWNNIDPVITPMVDDSNIAATPAEINALANLAPVITPRVDVQTDDGDLVASREEVEYLANLPPVDVDFNVDTTQLDAAAETIERMRTPPDGGDGAPPVPPEHIEGVMEMAQRYDELAESIRAEARAAADGTEEGEKEVKKLNAKAKAAASSAAQMRELANKTRTSTAENVKKGRSLDELIRDLEKTARAEEKLVEQLILEEKHSDAQVIAKRAKATNQLRNEYERLNQSLHKVNAVTRTAGEELKERFSDVTTMKQFEARVKEIAAELKEMKEAALAGADGINEMLKVAEKEEALKKLTTAGLGMDMTFKLLGKDLGVLGGIMASKFNQLGFVMFITLNTIKSLIGAVNTLKNAMIAVSDSLNFMDAFGAATTRAGIATDRFRLSLNDAAGGFVTWNEAQKVALELNLRGTEAVMHLGDEVLETSKKLAIATGGLQEFGETSAALVTALTKGDVTQLSDVLGFEAVAQELALVEMAAERAGEPLSDFERKEAGIRLTTAALEDMETALEGVEDAGERTRERVAALSELGPALGSAVGIIISEAFIGGPAADAQNSIQKLAADVMLGILDVGFAVFGALGSAATVAIGVIMGFLETAVEKFVAAKAIFEGGNIWDNLKIIGNPLAAADNMINRSTELLDAWSKNLNDTRDDIRKTVYEGLGIVPAVVDDAIMTAQDRLALFNKGIEASANIITNTLSDVMAQLDFLESPEFDFLKDLEKESESHGKRLVAIEDDYIKQRNKIRDKGAEDWEKAQKDFDKRAIENLDDLTDKILDINEDNELKVARMREDADDKRDEEKKKSAKKLEDIEVAHQRKINDILRRFGLSRLKALIDRDARALFEAERKRDEDLRKAEEARNQKRDDEKDDSKDRLNKIDEDSRKRIERANEDAQRRRDDAVKAHQKEMSDLQDQLEDTQQAILDSMEDRRKDLADDIKERHDAEVKAHDARIIKMKEDFRQEQVLIDAAALNARISALAETSTMADGWTEAWQQVLMDTEIFKSDYEDIVGDINTITSSINTNITIPGLGGSGGSAPPPVGGSDGGGNGCVGNATIDYTPLRAGISCSNVPANRTITACDGSKWHCKNMRWVQGEVQMGDPTGSGGSQLSADGGGGGNEWYGAGGAGPQQAQITLVTNDAKLDAILNEVVYDAVIDIMT